MEEEYLENLSTDWRIILKWIFDMVWGSMDWIGLSQERDWWQPLVKAVMNLCVPQNTGNFLTR